MEIVSEERPSDGGSHRSPDREQLCHQHEKLRQSQTEAEPGAMTFQDIRDRADRVRGIPLQEVLLLTGAKRDRYDKAKWHTPKGAISCTAAKFMNWNQGVGGGGAIDLAMHLNGLDFKAAVEWLWSRFPAPLTPKQSRPPAGEPAL